MSYYLLTIWIGYNAPALPAERPAARAAFDVIWPLASQAAWSNLLISATDTTILGKVNAEFQASIKSLCKDPNIVNATFTDPFLAQYDWRVGAGGLHEVATNTVYYTPSGGQSTLWQFTYHYGGGQKTRTVFAGAQWRDFLKVIP